MYATTHKLTNSIKGNTNERINGILVSSVSTYFTVDPLVFQGQEPSRRLLYMARRQVVV